MRIDSIRTADGHTQIRMSDTVDVSIEGDRLQSVTSVTIGDGTPGTGRAEVAPD
jgi:hypothetical protein